MIEKIIQLHVTGEIKHSIYYLIFVFFLSFCSYLCFLFWDEFWGGFGVLGGKF